MGGRQASGASQILSDFQPADSRKSAKAINTLANFLTHHLDLWASAAGHRQGQGCVNTTICRKMYICWQAPLMRVSCDIRPSCNNLG